MEERSVMSTNCLGCGCVEGAFHAKSCRWYAGDDGVKLLAIDVKQLIKSYGLDPRWATLDTTGVLTIAGSSHAR